MKKEAILIVIPYLASGAQGNELELAVAGWRKHFKAPYHIVVVGDWHPIVASGDDISFINCPQVAPIPGQYLPHLDHVHKFREVRKQFLGTDGFIYSCDDIYATADFGLDDVKAPKHPEIGPEFKLYEWRSSAVDWWSDRGKTGELCKMNGLPVRDWVSHLPVYYEWDRLFGIFDRYDCDHNSYVLENIYFNELYPDDIYIADAREYRDEIRSTNVSGLHPIGSRIWITNANCGWSEQLESILRKHYGL